MMTKTKGKEYLLEFDPSLRIPATWVTQKELISINILREDINTVSLYRGQGIVIKPLQQKFIFNIKDKAQEKQIFNIDKEISLSEELVDSNENGFCHHCKQLRSTYILASCNYNSGTSPQMMPVKQIVNGFHLPNIDPRQTQLINSLMIRKIPKNNNTNLQH